MVLISSVVSVWCQDLYHFFSFYAQLFLLRNSCLFPLASVGSSVRTLLAVRVAACPGPVSSQVAFCYIRCRCLTVSPWHLAFSPTSSRPAVTQRGGLPLVTGAHSACAQDRSGGLQPVPDGRKRPACSPRGWGPSELCVQSWLFRSPRGVELQDPW